MEQSQVVKMHELINDIWSEVMEVKVSDEWSRDRREKAIFALGDLRRHVDSMGLRHDLVDGPKGVMR